MRHVFIAILFLATTACSPDSGGSSSNDSEGIRSIAFVESASSDTGLIESHKGRIFLIGYVKDTNGSPVANAKILFHMGGSVNPWDDVVAFTDDNGRYQAETTSGVPYFAVSFKSGYVNKDDDTDLRGIAYLGQEIGRTTGTIPEIIMRKK